MWNNRSTLTNCPVDFSSTRIHLYIFFILKSEFAMSLSFLFQLKSGMKWKTDHFCYVGLFKRSDWLFFFQIFCCFSWVGVGGVQVEALQCYSFHEPVDIISSSTILSASCLNQSDPASSVKAKWPLRGKQQYKHSVRVAQMWRWSIKLTASSFIFYEVVYIYLNHFVSIPWVSNI